jgi:3-methyladenine DNA glycosylase AlkD
MTTLASVLAELQRRGSKKNIAGMARYGIVVANKKIFGVSVGELRDMGKKIGKNHALAAALWKTGWYEARMLAAFVDDPKLVTPAQMDKWAKDFDNWAICDTQCFVLFDKSPHAWVKINQWSKRKEEFVRRAAFALLASVALHDKKAPDAPFVKSFALIERYSTDDRNFVKKGVSWALRGIGKRKSMVLRKQALAVTKRMAGSADPTTRWIGKDALRDLA